MSCFLCNSSLGKKLVMSVTGCALVLFLLFHMAMNLVALVSPEAYNLVCAFLGANWYAVVATVGLAALVVLHFAYALVLTFNNYKARGSQRYAVTVNEPGRVGIKEYAFVGLYRCSRFALALGSLLVKDDVR